MPDRKAAQDWVSRTFDQLNERHFDGKLAKPQFAFFDRYRDPSTGAPKYAGYTHLDPVSLLIITDEALERGHDFAADSLLHEMIHHAIATLRRGDYLHHGPVFVEIANGVAAQLGLGAVEAETEGAICWPQTLRKPSASA